MNALNILMWSIIIYCIGGLLALLLHKSEGLSIKLAGLTGIVGGIVGIWASLVVLLSGEVLIYSTAGLFAFARFTVLFNGLSAVMVLAMSLLVVLCSLYSLSYVKEYYGKGAGMMGFFTNFFIASMVGLMVVDNSFYFIVLFEIMSLASWFLVLTDQKEASVKAGLLYFFIAHAGSVLIMASFFLMTNMSGSLDFATFRQLELSPVFSSVVFVLAFLGFGAKAGMLPLHSWLPKAHPAAPSHISALMSGVMVKVGIFGIIKVGIDILGASQMWWGILVLIVGAVSALLGILYALTERDIKRLLAWSTVENIGVILMGVGAGMIGIAIGSPMLAALSLIGALYHTINHAVFKGLLFMGAGAMMYSTHTRDMEQMGGLGRLMPMTAGCFLVGCLAISALPPLSGFASEWISYQALFNMSIGENSIILKLIGPIAMIMLAITGALAALCFVKMYGIAFCGKPRSEHAKKASEVPVGMTSAMVLGAMLCVLLGLGATIVVPVLADVANSLAKLGDVNVVQGSLVVVGTTNQAMLSPFWMAVLLLICALIPLVMYRVFRGQNYIPFRSKGDPWSAGYNWEPKMAINSRSLTQPLDIFFSRLFDLRRQLDPSAALQRILDWTIKLVASIEPFWDDKIIFPVARKVQRLGTYVQILQRGDVRVYCLYVVVAFVVVLVSLI